MTSKVYIDVYYYTDKNTGKEYARTVAGIFFDYADKQFKEIVITRTDNIAEYEPGNFYKRELPPILDVLDEIYRKGYKLDTIIVDGYVHMCEDDGKTYHPGLGKRLADALVGTNLEGIDIVGIAKQKNLNMTVDLNDNNNDIAKARLDFIQKLTIEMTKAWITNYKYHNYLNPYDIPMTGIISKAIAAANEIFE